MATQLAETPEGVETVETNDNTVVERDYEGEARKHGWRPETEFKGDASAWVDAKTFMERADTVMPLLKKQNHHLMAEINTLKSTVKKLQKSEQAAYENALADLKAKQEQAVEDGDIAAHREVGKKIEQLQKNADSQVRADVSQEQVVTAWNEFREANEWYDRADLRGATEDDMARRGFADREMAKMANVERYDQDHGPAEFMAELQRRIEERFPGKARPRAVENVAGVTRTGANRTAKIGANLPQEAKRAAERFIRIGIPGYVGLTAQQAHDHYAKSFDWEGYKA
jgi:hypothetical protein